MFDKNFLDSSTRVGDLFSKQAIQTVNFGKISLKQENS